MVTKKSKKEPTEHERQAWLVEYQTCQQEVNATGGYSFQSGIIFFVTTLTLAGIVITGVIKLEVSWYRLLLVCTLGLLSITSLYAWDRYTKRLQFIRRVVYDRMQNRKTFRYAPKSFH